MNITLINYNIDGAIDFIIYNTRPIRKRVQEVVWKHSHAFIFPPPISFFFQTSVV